MSFKNTLSAIVFVFCSIPALAEQNPVRLFGSSSYSHLLKAYKDQPFILVIWSITCSSCLKEMELLKSLHKNHPDLKIVMLATDDNSAIPEIKTLLNKHELTDTENWVFDSNDPQKLRFEIDPSWYGELPRTYFLDASHQREGISGVLNQTDYEDRLAKIKP